MENLIRILIVENEMILAAKTSLQLSELGYMVTGILPICKEVLTHVSENKPDLTLLDFHQNGNSDNIEIAKQLEKDAYTALIFITGNGDDDAIAKEISPAAFISKPWKKLQLQRTIELALCNIAIREEEHHLNSFPESAHPVILNDRIFIRDRDRMIKIMVEDILYIEADRNYSRLFTPKKEFLLCQTLKTIEEKLSVSTFVRTHRSYIVNVSRVDEVANGYVIVEGKLIPLSSSLRSNLINKIQTL